MDPFIKPYFVLPGDLRKFCSGERKQSSNKQKPNDSENNCGNIFFQCGFFPNINKKGALKEGPCH